MHALPESAEGGQHGSPGYHGYLTERPSPRQDPSDGRPRRTARGHRRALAPGTAWLSFAPDPAHCESKLYRERRETSRLLGQPCAPARPCSRRLALTLEEKKKAPARIVQFLRGLPKRVPKGLIDHYFAIDLRSLGLARIYLATLLLYNVVRRVPGISTWLTNEGLLPNHAVLWRPSANWMFSFFFAASTREEAAVMLAMCAAIFLALLVGWHTRLFHILSFVCVVSLDSRGIFLENGGDVVLNLLCAWTMFLPMGERFSVDALIAAHARAPRSELRRALASRRDRGADREIPFAGVPLHSGPAVGHLSLQRGSQARPNLEARQRRTLRRLPRAHGHLDGVEGTRLHQPHHVARRHVLYPDSSKRPPRS